MGPLGVQEMVIIFIVALVLFGPKKLPELGRTIGKAFTEFRRASNELKSTFNRELQTLERETESLKEVTAFTSETYNHYDSSYDSPYDYGAYGSEPYDSTASNPSTVGESETQDAEKMLEAPAAEGTQAVPGTVARTPGTEFASYQNGSAEHGSTPHGEGVQEKHGEHQHS